MLNFPPFFFLFIVMSSMFYQQKSIRKIWAILMKKLNSRKAKLAALNHSLAESSMFSSANLLNTDFTLWAIWSKSG